MKTLLRCIVPLAITTIVMLMSGACEAQDSPTPFATFSNQDVVVEVGKRIIAITAPVKNAQGEVIRFSYGSGYMLDAHHGLTAAHVLRDLRPGDAVAVQVGALSLGTNFITTGRILRFDSHRDLAMLWVDTGGGKDPRVSLKPPAKLCLHRPKPGSEFLVGGLSDNSTGERGIERHWNAYAHGPILNATTAPKTVGQDPYGYWHKGDNVLLSEYNANEGDSGAAVLEVDGCLAGIVSKNARLRQPINHDLEPMFIVPLSPGDQFLKH